MEKKGQEILSFLESSKKEMESFLSSLVAYETPSSDRESQENIFNHLIKSLSSLNFRCTRFYGKETGGFMTAVPKNRKKQQPIQLLIGHCDTVWKVGTLNTMPLINGETTIKGPGVFDMKAGITQMIFAIKALKELSIPMQIIPYCLINSDEEIGSRESSHAIKKLARIAERAYVLEPPMGLEGNLKIARKGLGRFTIKVKGKAAHAGLNPDQGASAILELSHQIQKLFSLNDAERGITVNVGMIEGGVSPNVVAAYSSAVADVRALTMEDARKITKKIFSMRPVDPNVELEIKGSFGRPPMEPTKRNIQLWESAKEAAKTLNIDIKGVTAGGGSDANTTSLYTATLDGLGTTGDGAHATHEYIVKDKLVERTALLAMLMLLPPQTLIKDDI